MWGGEGCVCVCKSWTIKKAERQRIDAFELWCWKRLWRVPWTARRSNQSILKAINPEYSLEGLILKLQYFGHLMWRANSLEKTLMIGKTEGRRRRGWQRLRWLHFITDSRDMSLSKLWETVKDRKAWHAAIHEIARGQTWLSDWTTIFGQTLVWSLASQAGSKTRRHVPWVGQWVGEASKTWGAHKASQEGPENARELWVTF